MDNQKIRLLLQITQSSSLSEVVNLGFLLLENPVFIDDMHRNILAYSTNVEIDDPDWQKNIVENTHDESDYSRIHSKRLYNESLQSHRPVLLTDLSEFGVMPRYGMTLTNYDIPIGNATVASYCRPFKGGDEELFTLFCYHATRTLLTSQYSLNRMHGIAVNTLIQLLNGETYPRKAIESKLFKPAEKSDISFSLFVISDKTGDALSLPTQPVMDLLAEIPDTFCFPFQKYLVFLIMGGGSHTDNDVTALQRILGRFELYAGQSRSFKDIMDLNLYYRQAEKALTICLDRMSSRICTYNDIAYIDMFDTLSEHDKLIRFCDTRVLRLFEYDQSHEKNLLTTFQVYLDSCMQFETTAQALFVHKNTVRYRIGKCRQLLEDDLSDTSHLFQYLLSICILRYLKMF